MPTAPILASGHTHGRETYHGIQVGHIFEVFHFEQQTRHRVPCFFGVSALFQQMIAQLWLPGP